MRHLRITAVQVVGIKGDILLVSQFTLYARLKKPKPDFSKAMAPDQVRAAKGNLVLVFCNPKP